MITYFNNRFLPKKEISISPDDRGFLFGDGVYEVIRSYSGKLFHADAHLNRLERSLRELQITGIDVENFRGISAKLLERNDLGSGDATIYIQVTRGAAPRKHSFPEGETVPTVYIFASPLQPPLQKMETGIKVILTPDIRWARCDIKSIALLPNVLANQQATDQGAEEAIFVRDGAITEGSHSNFCAVIDGELRTFPESHYILAGITRQVVLNLCRALGIPFREFPIFESELSKADELMILSTTNEVMPVVHVNDWKVADGKPGSVTLKLQKAFREFTRP
jgi:D-alanine transaminase